MIHFEQRGRLEVGALTEWKSSASLEQFGKVENKKTTKNDRNIRISGLHLGSQVKQLLIRNSTQLPSIQIPMCTTNNVISTI